MFNVLCVYFMLLLNVDSLRYWKCSPSLNLFGLKSVSVMDNGKDLALDNTWAVALMHWMWYPSGARYRNCWLRFYLFIITPETAVEISILRKDIVWESWGPSLVLCQLLSGISWSRSVWSGLESSSSYALIKLLSASVWKIVLFPLRTLFHSNLWCSQSSEVELTPWKQHVPIIFGWSFVPGRTTRGTRPAVKPP